jgi:hypothetical protein
MPINNQKLFIITAWAAVGLAVPIALLIVNELQPPRWTAMSGSMMDMEPPRPEHRVINAVVAASKLVREPFVIGLLVGCAAAGAGYGWLHATDVERSRNGRA